MSNSCLIHWFEQLLFGSTSPSPPPYPLKKLILRMEAESVPWPHIILQGGLTAFPYQVHGDLNSLIDHLEKEWLNDYRPRCKTKAVAKFSNELQRLLAIRDEVPRPALPEPLREDDAILKNMLEGAGYAAAATTPYTYEFQSAKFWGRVADRFIHLRRLETLPSLPSFSSSSTPSLHDQRLRQLYDMTCTARGQWLDPLTLHLVHHSEYVNAAHWQTPRNLEAFLHDRPSHPLTRTVRALLKQTVDQLLQGEPMTALPYPRLDPLLHNIRVIHESVEQVPHAQAPPKLIDIFQRLLALCHRDALWEEVIPAARESPDPFVGTSLLYLTEKVRILEQRLERDEEWLRGPPPRTCSENAMAGERDRRQQQRWWWSAAAEEEEERERCPTLQC